jgi:hypothetical protein
MVHHRHRWMAHVCCQMRNPRPSATWLSYDMACALAATCPPLNSRDVVCAGDELAKMSDPVCVISCLLQRGADLLGAPAIVEALRALHDLGA